MGSALAPMPDAWMLTDAAPEPGSSTKMLPKWGPAHVGAKVTVSSHDEPAAREKQLWVTSNDPMTWTNGELDGAVPVLVTVTVNGCDDVPTGTVPKSIEVGLTTRTGLVATAWPVPERLTVTGP